MSRLELHVDGITIATDGPIEAMAAIQRDAFEVSADEPDDAEWDRQAGALVAWLREQRARRTG